MYKSFSHLQLREHIIQNILINQTNGIKLKTWKIINFEWVNGNNLNKDFILLKKNVLNFILLKNNTHNK